MALETDMANVEAVQPADRHLVQAEAVVALAGHSGSGKSALSAAVADRHNETAVVRFVDAVREQAEAAGFSPDDPDVLVRLGAGWVKRDPRGFCKTVLTSGPRRANLLVIEGIHHEVIRQHLVELVAPLPDALRDAEVAATRHREPLRVAGQDCGAS